MNSPIRYLSLLLSCITLLTAPGCGGNEEQPGPNPNANVSPAQQVLLDYFGKIREGGFASAVPFIHPGELTRFRKMMMEEMQEPNSDSLLGMFRDEHEMKKLEQLPAAEFVATFYEWLNDRKPNLKVEPLDEGPQVIGEIREGEDVHVVFRANAVENGAEFSQVGVMTLRLYEGKYMMLLNGQIRRLKHSASIDLQRFERENDADGKEYALTDRFQLNSLAPPLIEQGGRP